MACACGWKGAIAPSQEQFRSRSAPEMLLLTPMRHLTSLTNCVSVVYHGCDAARGSFWSFPGTGSGACGWARRKLRRDHIVAEPGQKGVS